MIYLDLHGHEKETVPLPSIKAAADVSHVFAPHLSTRLYVRVRLFCRRHMPRLFSTRPPDVRIWDTEPISMPIFAPLPGQPLTWHVPADDPLISMAIIEDGVLQLAFPPLPPWSPARKGLPTAAEDQWVL